MFLPWQLSIVILSILGALRTIQNRIIGKNQADLSLYVLAASFFCVGLGGLIIGFSLDEPVVASDALKQWYFFALMAVSLTINNYLTFKLFRLLQASIISIASLLNSLAVVLIASFFLGEKLSASQWLGSIVLFCAVLLVQVQPQHKLKRKKLSISKSFLLILVIAITFGVGVVSEKHLLDTVSLSTYLVFGWGAQSVGVFSLVFLLRKKLVFPRSLISHAHVWLSAVLLLGGGFFFVHSVLDSNSSSLTSVSSSLKVTLAVVFSYFLLHERDQLLKKLASLLLSSIGLVLLFS